MLHAEMSLVLLDFHMPELNGAEVLAPALRSGSGPSSTPGNHADWRRRGGSGKAA
jgi:CheY-like chemotaxis protein